MDYWIQTEDGRLSFLFHTSAKEDLNVYLYRLHLSFSPGLSFLPQCVCVTLESGEYNVSTRTFTWLCVFPHMCGSNRCVCVFGALLGSICVSRAAQGRLCVWLQVRVETQRLRFQSGSTVVLHRPSEVKV